MCLNLNRQLRDGLQRLSIEVERTNVKVWLTDTVSGDVDDIINPTGEPVVPVAVTAAAIAGEVVALEHLEVGRLEALRVSRERAHHAGPRALDHQVPEVGTGALVRLAGLTSVGFLPTPTSGIWGGGGGRDTPGFDQSDTQKVDIPNSYSTEDFASPNGMACVAKLSRRQIPGVE